MRASLLFSFINVPVDCLCCNGSDPHNSWDLQLGMFLTDFSSILQYFKPPHEAFDDFWCCEQKRIFVLFSHRCRLSPTSLQGFSPWGRKSFPFSFCRLCPLLNSQRFLCPYAPFLLLSNLYNLLPHSRVNPLHPPFIITYQTSFGFGLGVLLKSRENISFFTETWNLNSR